MLKKKPPEKSFKWEEQVQAISTVILTTIAIISIVFSLGKDQEKLENLETEIKDINVSLKTALLNQGMNANCASYPKVSLGRGFKNPTREDSYLKSATP
jgi:hypothetical protein